MKYITTLILTTFFALNAYCQDTTFLSRLRGLHNNDIFFFNVDGIDISSHHTTARFSRTAVDKEARKLAIASKNLSVRTDGVIGVYYYGIKTEEVNDTLTATNSCYFIENKDHDLLVITFAKVDSPDRKFEQVFIKMLLGNTLPGNIMGNMSIDTVNFAGRNIRLGKACIWKGVNNIEFGYTQMNWSVCSSMQLAQRNLNMFMAKNSGGKGTRVEARQDVDAIFEGKEIKVKKISYKITGTRAILAKMSQMNYLTVYYVVTELRGNYVFCLLSKWDEDLATASNKLPPLLSEVMTLK